LVLRLPGYTVRAVKLAAVLLPAIALVSVLGKAISVVRNVQFSAKTAVSDGKKRIVIALGSVFVTGETPVGTAVALRDVEVCGSVRNAVALRSVTAGDPEIRRRVTGRFAVGTVPAAGKTPASPAPAEK
ncbi:MAG: hypothetical protein RRY21_05660, partial [Oscillospiraceae bacterium]